MIQKLPFWLALALMTFPLSSHAGEGFFSRLYTTDTEPAGEFEIEQLVRNRQGRSFGSYSAFDNRTELEYGFNDNFQGSLYVNWGHVKASGAPDDDHPDGENGFTENKLYLQSLSFEMTYRVLSPITSPIGLAFDIEPEYYFTDFHNGMKYDRTFSMETRVILQKNFLDDTLIFAYNMITEFEFIRFAGEENWKGELDWNHEIGVSYRVAPKWFVGL